MTTAKAEEIRYGNLREPKLPGFMGLGLMSSAILVLGALIMMLLIFFANLWVGLIFMGVLIALVGPQAIKIDGQGFYTKRISKMRFNRAEKKKTNVLVQGLTGFIPDGECRLPGVAAKVRLTTERDVHGREFALIHWPTSDLYSVAINCFPTGNSGLDKEITDAQVEQWAAWLAQLQSIGEVVGASVVIESAPDSGERLRQAIDRGRHASAPEFAQQLADQIKTSSRAGSPVLAAWITLTFNAKYKSDMTKETRVRTREEVAAEIGDALPTLTGTLDGTGAGQGSLPATVQELTDAIRIAYDPAVAELVDEARYTPEGTGLTWDQAGPTMAVNHFDFYRHETALSRTWQMREAPRGLFFSKVLDTLLAPHRDVARKRVVLLYRPESAERSEQLAMNDLTAAKLVASSNPRKKVAQQIAVKAAEKTAEQEALGSPLIRVGLLVTVTVLDEDQLDRASSVVLKQLAPQARLRMRLPRGAQDSAFVAGLPLGMVPYYHGGLSNFTEGA